MMKRYLVIGIIVLAAFAGGYAYSQRGHNTSPATNNASSGQSTKTVNLSGQELTTIPESVLAQSDITELNLSNNQLTTLPAGISRLRKLEVLNVENNRIASFPNELSQLKQLRQLLANNNRMNGISGQLETMTWLQQLDLSGNNIPAADMQILKAKLSSTQVKS